MHYILKPLNTQICCIWLLVLSPVCFHQIPLSSYRLSMPFIMQTQPSFPPNSLHPFHPQTGVQSWFFPAQSVLHPAPFLPLYCKLISFLRTSGQLPLLPGGLADCSHPLVFFLKFLVPLAALCSNKSSNKDPWRTFLPLLSWPSLHPICCWFRAHSFPL